VTPIKHGLHHSDEHQSIFEKPEEDLTDSDRQLPSHRLKSKKQSLKRASRANRNFGS
jgi:hypothetical protein